MNVFLTGASGFIGAYTAHALLDKGHRIAALVLPEDPLPRLQPLASSLEIVRATLGDKDVLDQAIRAFQPEACVHLAWYAEPGKYMDADENIASLSQSLSLFHLLIKSGCRSIAAAGTCFEYDTDYGYLREETPTRPASLYAAAKLSCFLTGSRMAAKAGVRFAWGRIFYPYGPMEDPRRLVPAAIAALQQGLPFPASPGGQIRDYIHVADVASAFCALLGSSADGVFNISSGMPVSVGQLLEAIGQLAGRADLIQLGALPYRHWEPPFICGNNQKLKDLGWMPHFTLTEGLQDTCQSVRKMTPELKNGR